jgi:ribosome-associated protein
MKNLVKEILDILDNNKAQDIERLDVSHLSPFIETILICTAGSTPHSKSLADKVTKKLKTHKESQIKIEGYNTGEWILITHGFLVIHIFQAEQREMYNLEKLWKITTKPN